MQDNQDDKIISCLNKLFAFDGGINYACFLHALLEDERQEVLEQKADNDQSMNM